MSWAVQEGWITKNLLVAENVGAEPWYESYMSILACLDVVVELQVALLYIVFLFRKEMEEFPRRFEEYKST